MKDTAGGLPHFLIVGAQKAGTTWLLHMLRQHPGIFMPPGELHFFNKRENYRRGLRWYRRYFTRASEEQIQGEKTPNYLWVNVPVEGTDLPASHTRIADWLPDVRIIAILRDPVERAVSAYNHHLRKGRFPPDAPMEEVLFGEHRDLARRHGVIAMGHYHVQLSAYLERFDRDQILVLEFGEDVERRPGPALERVCEFLRVDPTFGFENVGERCNVRRESVPQVWANYWLPPVMAERIERVDELLPPMPKRKPDQRVRERLIDIYREETDDLRGLLDRNLEEWHV